MFAGAYKGNEHSGHVQGFLVDYGNVSFAFQALWYPLNISSEQFVFEQSKEGKAIEGMVKR